MEDQNQNNTNIFCKHIWSYCFTISGNKATRTPNNKGFYPMALRQSVPKNGTSTYSIKVKVINSEVRFGLASQNIIAKDSWTRQQFIFFDANLSRLNKCSIVSYKIRQVGQKMPFVEFGQVVLKMKVNMTTKKVSWYRDDKHLIEVEIPKQINGPLHPFFSLQNAGDSCQFI